MEELADVIRTVQVQEQYPEPSVPETYSIISYPSSALPEQYVGMIYSNWLRSFRHGSIGGALKKTDSDSFYKNYHDFIENLMKKPDSICRLAVLTSDTDVVLGFSVSREDVLDYLYVQKQQRNQGIGTKLVPEGITTITHITNNGYKFWQEKFKDWKLNPFA